MLWILERGSQASVAAPAETLLRFGAPPSYSPGRTIVCSLTPEPSIYLCRGYAQDRLPLELEADSCLAQLPGDEQWVEFSWRPWWKEGRSQAVANGLSVHLSLQTWKEGVWYDGPLRIDIRGACIALVAAGAAGRLLWRETLGEAPLLTDQGAMDILRKERPMALKQSLALGLRQGLKIEANQGLRLVVKRWDRGTIARLILLRVAFHETFLIYAETPPDPAWKRLFQNLNIRLNVLRASPALSIDEVWPEEDEKALAEWLLTFQAIVPVVPEGLLKRYSSERPERS